MRRYAHDGRPHDRHFRSVDDVGGFGDIGGSSA